MALMLILALLGCDEKAANEKAVSEALEKFKTDYKAKETADKVKAIEELAKHQHDKITGRLASLFTAEEKGVRIAAAKGLGDRTEEKDKKKAATALNSVLKPNEKFPEVQTAILEAIAKLGDETGLPEVHKLLDSEADGVALAAITTASTVKSKSSFEPLVKRLKEADEVLKPRDQKPDAKNAFGGGFGGGRMLGGPQNGKPTNNDTPPMTFRERRDFNKKIQDAIMKVLAEWTGVHCEDGKDWDAWWKENQNKFKFAKS